MTPEEAAYVAQLEAQVRPKRRVNGMWALTNQPFMETDPFSAESPFDLKSPFEMGNPFFPKKRRQ